MVHRNDDPPEPIEYPCAWCGQTDCECDLMTLKPFELADRIQLMRYQLAELEKEAKRREYETAPCPVCGKKQRIDVFLDHPIWCCGHEFEASWRPELP